jgi:hypothetical protein
MEFARPLALVTPTLDGDVLAALAVADEEFSGRELARRVGRGSPEGIRRAADRLVGQGVLSLRVVGSAHLYRLNRDHLAAPWIEGLATLREQLLKQLRTLVGAWAEPPLIVMLFGSVADGSAANGSDMDLLVVRRAGCDPDSTVWREQLESLSASATRWTGNDTRVLEYGETELQGMATEPVIADVAQRGIEIFGSRRALRLLSGRAATQ